MIKKVLFLICLFHLTASSIFAMGEPVKVTFSEDLKQIKNLNIDIVNKGYFNQSQIKQQKLKDYALTVIKKMLSKRGITVTNKSSRTLYIENIMSSKLETSIISVPKSSTTYPIKYEPGKILTPQTTYYTETETVQNENVYTTSYAQIKKGNKEIAFAETNEINRYSQISSEYAEDIIKDEIKDLIEGLFGKIEGEEI